MPELKSCAPARSGPCAKCTCGPIGAATGGRKASTGRPTSRPCPTDCDWDLWIGTAPLRPYHPAYVPFAWRGWLDFGTGAIGDMGIHNAAMAWLGLATRTASIGRGGRHVRDQRRDVSGLVDPALGVSARGPLPPVTMYWYDGGKQPPPALIGGQSWRSTARFSSVSRARMYSIEWTGADWHLLPADKFRDYQPPEPSVPRASSHHGEWIAACKGDRPALCNFIDFGAPLTEVMLLGNLALARASGSSGMPRPCRPRETRRPTSMDRPRVSPRLGAVAGHVRCRSQNCCRSCGARCACRARRSAWRRCSGFPWASGLAVCSSAASRCS